MLKKTGLMIHSIQTVSTCMAEVYDCTRTLRQCRATGIKQCLVIEEKNLGPNHPDVAITVNGLWPALTNYHQGKYAEAEPLFKRSGCYSMEKALGPDHHWYVAQKPEQSRLALYDDQGKYARRNHSTSEAVAIDEKALGPDHPSVATALNNLGRALHRPGQVRQGGTALQACDSHLGKNPRPGSYTVAIRARRQSRRHY